MGPKWLQTFFFVGLMGPSWVRHGCRHFLLGVSWGLLGISCGRSGCRHFLLKASWGHLGPKVVADISSWGLLGAILVPKRMQSFPLEGLVWLLWAQSGCRHLFLWASWGFLSLDVVADSFHSGIIMCAHTAIQYPAAM